jgi:hypothetical protein
MPDFIEAGDLPARCMMEIKTLTMALLVNFALAAEAGAVEAQITTASRMEGGTDFDPTYRIPANVPADAAFLATMSVSEQEAKLWVLNAGYDQVSGLVRGESNLYRGTALLGHETYDVVVDAAGNVLGIKR